jgi:uncharacterized membrane protein
MTTPQKTFIALVAVAVAQVLYFYPQLPETMATHFDGAGHPNGCSTKVAFFGVMFGMMGLMAAVFLVLPRSFSRMPQSWISLPYRDYWLSEERRAETVRFIEQQSAWFGVVTQLLIIATTQFTIDANLRPCPQLPVHFMWVFWAYMGFTAVWTVHFVGHFVRVRKRQSAV